MQDLLPYYREGASNDEIRRWIPSLTDEEIALLKDYIRDHCPEVESAERAIKAHHDRLRAQQPAWTRLNDHLSLEERQALMRKKLAENKGKKRFCCSSMRTSTGSLIRRHPKQKTR